MFAFFARLLSVQWYFRVTMLLWLDAWMSNMHIYFWGTLTHSYLQTEQRSIYDIFLKKGPATCILDSGVVMMNCRVSLGKEAVL